MTATRDNAVADLQRANAELQRQLAEARAERDEALEQQTATAEVLQVINASRGDLAPVFDAILEKALDLCDSAFGVMHLYESERFRPVATRGVPAAFAAYKTKTEDRHGPGGAHTRLRRGEPLVHIHDLKDEEAYRVGEATRRAVVDLGGARTAIVVPLRKDSAFLGSIVVYRQEVRPFTDKQIALVQNFAAQAVIAIENARLITETREALEQQTATAEVLGVINSSPGDLAPVFDAMLEKALRLCGGTYGSLLRYDGERYHVLALVHADGALSDRLMHRSPIEVGPANPIVGGATIAFHEDLRESELYRRDHLFREFVDTGGYQSVLDVAMRKEGVLFGVIAIFRQETGPFTERQIELVRTFADQAVIAMENARLLGELRERTEEIAGWNRELEARVAAQLAEIERTGKLRRFLAPQLADLIVAQGDDKILESHRREIVVVFCDLRGFTGFAERAEPEEVMALLRDYHAAMGPIVAQYEGTIDHYGGDGIMVFFNDPVPTPDPAKRAIDMAVAMRERSQPLLRTWRRHGHDLGFGVGIAQGYATLGQIGFAERMDYTAIGTVTNLAARLCAAAKNGQILVSSRVATAIEDNAALEEIGDLALKGLSQAVAVYNVVAVGAQASPS